MNIIIDDEQVIDGAHAIRVDGVLVGYIRDRFGMLQCREVSQGRWETVRSGDRAQAVEQVIHTSRAAGVLPALVVPVVPQPAAPAATRAPSGYDMSRPRA